MKTKRERIVYSEREESTAIVNFIVNRIKKGLGCNIIIVGPPGMGKSYLCLRVMELVHEQLKIKKKMSMDNVAKSLEEAFRFVRNVKTPGQCLVIEEVSVLAGSRRSMSADNVEFNYLLDTIRKKQIILLMNSPHSNFIDNHIRMLSQLQIECKRLNRSQGVVIVSSKKLNTSASGKVYERRFSDKNGWDIWTSHFNKPSKELTDAYEDKKDVFMDHLYELIEAKAKDRAEKEMKKLKGKPLGFKTDLTDKEAEVYREIYLKKRTMTELAKERGVSVQAISNMLEKVEKKGNLLGKSTKSTLNGEILPL